MTFSKHSAHLKRLREDKKLAVGTELASVPDSENVPAVSSLTAQDSPQIILEQSIASLKRQCDAKKWGDTAELIVRHNAAIASIEGLTYAISSLSAQLSSAQAEFNAQHQSLQASENALQKSHLERQKLHERKERFQCKVQFLKTSVTPEQREAMQKRAREGMREYNTNAQRMRIAEALSRHAAENARKAKETKRKREERQAREDSLLDGKEIELDLDSINQTVSPDLDIQIKLARRLDLKIPSTKKNIIPAPSSLEVPEKKAALCEVVEKWGHFIVNGHSSAFIYVFEPL
jgi:hypothetical protein